jgi:hypothetical protein
MLNKITKAVVYADLHAPFYDPHALNILCQVVADEKPDYVVDLGDTGDWDSISRFNKGQPGRQEGQRLIKDIKSVRVVDAMIYSAAGDKAQRIKHHGNHEQRLERYLNEHPELKGVIEEVLGNELYKGIKEIDHGQFSTIGKLMFHHGDRRGYQSIHHAKQWASIGRSIVYGHHHSVQQFPHETLTRKGSPDKHRAFSIGCLCDLNRDWMENQKSLWQQSFAVIYFDEQGFFYFYNVDITNKKTIWNGKAYRG